MLKSRQRQRQRYDYDDDTTSGNQRFTTPVGAPIHTFYTRPRECVGQSLLPTRSLPRQLGSSPHKSREKTVRTSWLYRLYESNTDDFFLLLLLSSLFLLTTHTAQNSLPQSAIQPHMSPFPPLRMLGCITADTVLEICVYINIYVRGTSYPVHPKHTTPRSHRQHRKHALAQRQRLRPPPHSHSPPHTEILLIVE